MKRSKKKLQQVTTTRGVWLPLVLAVFTVSAVLPATLSQSVESNEIDQTSNDIINPDEFSNNDQYHYIPQVNPIKYTEINVENNVINGEKVLDFRNSPYLLRSDIEVGREGKLSIEAGVTIYFAPMVGITVRGALKAIVSTKFYKPLDKLYTFLKQNNKE